jgi:hypothetical protein
VTGPQYPSVVVVIIILKSERKRKPKQLQEKMQVK